MGEIIEFDILQVFFTNIELLKLLWVIIVVNIQDLASFSKYLSNQRRCKHKVNPYEAGYIFFFFFFFLRINFNTLSADIEFGVSKNQPTLYILIHHHCISVLLENILSILFAQFFLSEHIFSRLSRYSNSIFLK